jgi:hypothetical protein
VRFEAGAGEGAAEDVAAERAGAQQARIARRACSPGPPFRARLPSPAGSAVRPQRHDSERHQRRKDRAPAEPRAEQATDPEAMAAARLCSIVSKAKREAACRGRRCRAPSSVGHHPNLSETVPYRNCAPAMPNRHSVTASCIVLRESPKSAAASGNTGTRMCIARVPAAVTATRTQNGARPAPGPASSASGNIRADQLSPPHPEPIRNVLSPKGKPRATERGACAHPRLDVHSLVVA